MDILNGNVLILGSKSPRRSMLLKESKLAHIIKSIEVEEKYPSNMPSIDIPIFLAELKASVHHPINNEIILTSDTIVVLDHTILGKPKNENDAIKYLKLLSGKTHQVITGFVLKSKVKSYSEAVVSEVTMDILDQKEIKYYIDQYKPYDKAGGYGIQEWIGHTNVLEIKGSYNNIMGLPTHAVYKALKMFCE